MDILHLIAANNFIPVNKILIKAFGTDCAIIIGHFAGLQLYHKEPFYNTAEQIEEETGIKIHSIRKAISLLEEAGVLTVKKKGLPCKSYYWLNNNAIIEALENNTQTSFEKTKNKSLENIQTSNEKTECILNKNYNNKINKLNNIIVADKICNNDTKEKESFLEVKQQMKRTKTPQQTKQAIKDRQLKQFIPYAYQLAKIIESNKNIKIIQSPAKIQSWAKEFKTLIEKQDVPVNRIEDALEWYSKNIGGEYIPVIESGRSFREKFLKLEDAIKRGTKPLTSQKPKLTLGTHQYNGRTVDYSNISKVHIVKFKD